MFLRKKIVKDNEYLYAVENFWKNGMVRQKVRKYLGRIYCIKKSKSISFFGFINRKKRMNQEDYLNSADYDSIVYDIVRWELYRRGFKINEVSAEKCELKADFTKRKNILNCKGRPFCISCEEGYINNLSINKILNAKKCEDFKDDKKEAFDFAKLFIDGGIEVPKEVFTELFAKRFIDIDFSEKQEVINY